MLPNATRVQRRAIPWRVRCNEGLGGTCILGQDRLNCPDGFTEAGAILDRAGEAPLKERFTDLQLAINVLKHGRGRSYDALVATADALTFRVKAPGDAFFFEGDVSEVSTLIEVNDAFVLDCAEVIRDVSAAIERVRPGVFI